jgi:hypothetical protein
MPIIKIDNKDYELDTLPQATKDLIQSIQFVDRELVRMQAHVAALQTAKTAYVRALKDSLPNEAEEFSGDTIKL